MVRPSQRALTASLAERRDDLVAILRAGIDRAAARRLLARAIADDEVRTSLASRPLHVVAAGKASCGMMTALVTAPGLTIASALAVGSHRHGDLPPTVEWRDAGHPLPDERSVSAGARTLEAARRVSPSEHLVLLLSGGASALVAAPLEGLRLEDKQRVIRTMMHGGADIHALNTVRKHMSAIKGGRLAATCRGTTWTLAISDVVSDEVSTIGSGPGVADTTTWQNALDLLTRFGGCEKPVEAVATLFRRGIAGEIPETPRPDDPRLARVQARVIGGRGDAVEGARLAAEARGYHVTTLPEPVIGEARVSGKMWIDRLAALVAGARRPLCVLSAGETTVRVTGGGKGGRNQEFALAMVGGIARPAGPAVAASVGTDGVDGPTDAAGALVDGTTLARARAHGLADPSQYLDDNNSFAFFDALGDLIHTGPTDTNVGDLQAALFD